MSDTGQPEPLRLKYEAVCPVHGVIATSNNVDYVSRRCYFLDYTEGGYYCDRRTEVRARV